MDTRDIELIIKILKSEGNDSPSEMDILKRHSIFMRDKKEPVIETEVKAVEKPEPKKKKSLFKK